MPALRVQIPQVKGTTCESINEVACHAETYRPDNYGCNKCQVVCEDAGLQRTRTVEITDDTDLWNADQSHLFAFQNELDEKKYKMLENQFNGIDVNDYSQYWRVAQQRIEEPLDIQQPHELNWMEKRFPPQMEEGSGLVLSYKAGVREGHIDVIRHMGLKLVKKGVAVILLAGGHDVEDRLGVHVARAVLMMGDRVVCWTMLEILGWRGRYQILQKMFFFAAIFRNS